MNAGLRAELLATAPAHLPRIAAGRLPGLAAGAAAAALFVASLAVLDISPGRIWSGLSQLALLAELMFPPVTGGHAAIYLEALGQTLAIALLGTLLASLPALPLGFLAARNVVGNPALHFAIRRFLDVLRSIDVLVWALVWINVVGLGPFAGVLAIASSDTGAMAKLLSEAVEAADRRPVEGVLSGGGSRLLATRFGVFPQVLPVFTSQVLYFFESNTRSATIIGIVGAGGIGLHLFEQIRVLEWQQASFLILLVLLTVAVIDMISRRLRAWLVGPG